MHGSRKDSAPAWVPPLLGAIMLALVARVLTLGISPLIVLASAVFAVAILSSALNWRWD